VRFSNFSRRDEWQRHSAVMREHRVITASLTDRSIPHSHSPPNSCLSFGRFIRDPDEVDWEQPLASSL
jgi:hypothetical protein